MANLLTGKLPAAMLEAMLEQYSGTSPRLLVGPGIGRDAAVIDMGDRCLVAKTDPVTFATDQIGWYAVHVNANDVACVGALPRWFLATVLLPERTTSRSLVEEIFAQVASACRQLDVTLCGGHTEITHGIDRPIVVGQMLGEVSHDGYLSASDASPGDRLILTKGIAIEGTALIARECEELARSVLSSEQVARCAGLLKDPGISVVPEAMAALAVGGVHAMHDPTEGGVATGLWELAEAAHVGVLVDEDALPVLPECAALCESIGIDPLGLIASGSLLISARAERAGKIVSTLDARGIPAVILGEITEAGGGCRLRSKDGALRPLPQFARDEIARLFD